jgi:hypothetical protein
MRKLLVGLTLLASIGANAQYVSTTTTAAKTAGKTVKSYKPQAGTVTAEFGLSGGLLETNLSLNNNAGLLRFRYFTSDDLAFRIGASLTNRATTTNVYGATGTPQAGVAGSKVTKGSGITLNLGVEKHLTGSDRLSTYIGADLIVTSTSAKENWDNFNGTNFNLGSKRELKGENSVGGKSTTGFGLRLVTGAEYYFVKNVYIGAELGFGFLASKFKDVKDQITTAVTVGGTTTTTTTNNDRKSPGKSFEFSPSVITGVRLGFQF